MAGERVAHRAASRPGGAFHRGWSRTAGAGRSGGDRGDGRCGRPGWPRCMPARKDRAWTRPARLLDFVRGPRGLARAHDPRREPDRRTETDDRRTIPGRGDTVHALVEPDRPGVAPARDGHLRPRAELAGHHDRIVLPGPRGPRGKSTRRRRRPDPGKHPHRRPGSAVSEELAGQLLGSPVFDRDHPLALAVHRLPRAVQRAARLWRGGGRGGGPGHEAGQKEKETVRAQPAVGDHSLEARSRQGLRHRGDGRKGLGGHLRSRHEHGPGPGCREDGQRGGQDRRLARRCGQGPDPVHPHQALRPRLG